MFCSAKSRKLVFKRRRLVSSYFNLIFIYEQWLVITASREDLAAVVFVSNKFMSSCLICLAIWKRNFPTSVGLFGDDKSFAAGLPVFLFPRPFRSRDEFFVVVRRYSIYQLRRFTRSSDVFNAWHRIYPCLYRLLGLVRRIYILVCTDWFVSSK